MVTGNRQGAAAGKAPSKEQAVNPREVIELGAEALSVVRNTLAMRYRFLDRALWKMELVATPLVNLVGTDTRKLYYNPTDVLRRFAAGSDELARDVLHAIFHCLFYHPFVRSDIDQGLWDLATDMAVEAACLELAGKAFPVKGDEERAQVIGQFESSLGNLSAEKLYMHFTSDDVSDEELLYLDALFIRDEHGLWYTVRDGVTPAPPEEPLEHDDAVHLGGGDARDTEEKGSSGAEPVEADAGAGDGADDATAGAEDAELPAADDEAQDAVAPSAPDETAREEWEHISRRVKVELNTAIDRYGTEAGSLATRLAVANRKRYDYRSFLSRFAEIREEMRLNPDEFDLIYYSYGMDTYGNVPLIEPLEYTDSNKIRTFVIAIDTSGSVQGELVERFVEETYAILEESASFFEKCQVRVIQCDARVQDEAVLEDRAQLAAYLEDFELRGMGGTDFRPVFEHVDALVESGEVEGLRGLVYFTDGRGTYPATPPDYECVFVFVDDERDAPPVPPWAYKLVLDEFQLRFLEKGGGTVA